jgi:hypothetical protein
MTLAVLENIKAGLKKENIDLNFEKLEFDSADGKLSFIKFSVDCNDGFKGSAGLPLSKDKKSAFTVIMLQGLIHLLVWVFSVSDLTADFI